MKQFKFYSLASAMLLAGAVGLNSCSSDSVEPGGAPGIAGQVVKTQFAINIPYAKGSGNNAKAMTRMTEDNTQANGGTANFRGIDDLRLFTLSAQPTPSSTCTDNIFIGNGENASSFGTAGDWRSVYSDVAITVGTKNLILYGFAGNRANQESDKIGKLNRPTNIEETKSLSDLTFSLAPIHSASISENQNEATNIITALNGILDASATYTSGETQKTVKWSEIGTNIDYSSENERKALKGLLDRFTKLTAGSAASCIATINGLITQLGDPTEDQKLRSAIKNQCNNAIRTLDGNNFPRNLKLPDGIAKIKYTAGSGFAYVDEVQIGSNSIDYKKISYPAELTYFVSSEAMASDNVLANVTGFPEYDIWTNDANNTDEVWTAKGFSKEGVKESTRTVALKKPLRYGVANMKLSVSCASETLDDNAVAQANQSAANVITVKGEGFPVKAVLVGGQPEKVAWDYEPTSSEQFKYTIYDTDMNKTKNAGSDGQTQELDFAARYNGTKTYNYTLVLDNFKKDENGSAASDQDDVYITIELENNSGEPFYGSDGLIPAGGRFYLVGKIDKSKFTESITHAFVKDYTTEVNLSIKSLKSAYNCIPDLRSSQISLGLAVDLKWEKGITFTVDL